MVERAKEDPRFLGKWNKKSTLAVVYATSEEERDEFKATIYKDLRGRKLLKKTFLPYR